MNNYTLIMNRMDLWSFANIMSNSFDCRKCYAEKDCNDYKRTCKEKNLPVKKTCKQICIEYLESEVIRNAGNI